MLAQLNILYVIFFVTGLAVAYSYIPLAKHIGQPQLHRWLIYWAIGTTVLVMGRHFWLYTFIMSLFLMGLNKIPMKEKLAVGLILILTQPSMAFWYVHLPGGILITHLSPQRIIHLVLLVPIWLQLRKQSDYVPFLKKKGDVALLIFLIVQSLAAVRSQDLTQGVRLLMENGIDFILVYVIITRLIKDIESIRFILYALVFTLSILSVMTVYEAAKFWTLYPGTILGLQLPLPPTFIGVGEFRAGFLRAEGPMGFLTLGLSFALAIGSWVYLTHRQAAKSLFDIGILGGLVIGLVFTWSRAPWLCGVLIMCLFALQAEKKSKMITRSLLALIIATPLLFFTPVGQKIVQILPFVGTSDQRNVEFRGNLLDNGIEALTDSPVNLLTGMADPYSHPAIRRSRAGHGIIDITNTYLLHALHTGLIGLALFIWPFLRAIHLGYQRAKRLRGVDDDAQALARMLVAMMAAVMAYLATASPINQSGFLLYFLLSILVAFLDIPIKNHRGQSV